MNRLIAATGTSLTAGLVACYLICCLNFFLGGSLAGWPGHLIFPLGMLCGFCFTRALFGPGRSACNSTRLWIELSVLIIIATAGVCVLLQDFSYDGNVYHQDTIAALMLGWNPFLDPMQPGLSLWAHHYAKGMEILSASAAVCFGNIEAGKCINLIMIAGPSLLFASTLYSILRTRIGSRATAITSAILIALAAALNPVGMSQSFTYYIDFPKYYLLLAAISLLVHLFRRDESQSHRLPEVLTYALLSGVMVLAIDIKFNAAPDMAFLVLTAFFIALGMKRKHLAINILVAGFIAAIASTCIFGFHPYVTNIIHASHPLYPLMGSGATDIMSANTPIEFQGADRFSNFAASYLNPDGDLKVSYDERHGGFTPIMPLILLLSLAALVWRFRKFPVWLVASLGVVIASCFIFEQSWWARYMCQLWLFPIGVASALAAMSAPARAESLLARTIALLCIAAGGITFVNSAYHSFIFTQYRHDIYSFQPDRNVPVANLTPAVELQLKANGFSPVKSSEENLDSLGYVYFYGYTRVDNNVRIRVPKEHIKDFKKIIIW